MALFHKLFPSRNKQRNKGCCRRDQHSESPKKWRGPSLKEEQVRLVIYRDHDIKGRQLVYDSVAVTRIEPGKDSKQPKKCCKTEQNVSQLTDSCDGLNEWQCRQGPKYQFEKRGSDAKLLGEMMYGSVPMTSKGTAFKVHCIRLPPQLMVTKVFIEPKTNRESSGLLMDNDDSCSLTSSTSEYLASGHEGQSLARSIPVAVPSPPAVSANEEDSGFAASSLASSDGWVTPFPSPGSNSSLNSNSYNSMHKRWMRAQSMRLDYGLMRRHSGEFTAQLNEGSLPTSRRKAKLGMAVVFNLTGQEEEIMQFQSFFFSHIALLEGNVNKLKAAVERACMDKRNFVHLVYEAFATFRQEILDLYTAPRICEPVWLTMMATNSYRHAILSQKFLGEFMSLVEKYDTKNTSFFLSSLITAVLTHHLAWVPTVTPAGATPSRTYLDKHSAKWLDTLARTHPYNPLWAQLGDLYGAIGFPLKLARTIVVGKKADLVRKLLFVLTYFIRCSEVHESGEHSWEPLEVDFVDIEEGSTSQTEHQRELECRSPGLQDRSVHETEPVPRLHGDLCLQLDSLDSAVFTSFDSTLSSEPSVRGRHPEMALFNRQNSSKIEDVADECSSLDFSLGSLSSLPLTDQTEAVSNFNELVRGGEEKNASIAQGKAPSLSHHSNMSEIQKIEKKQHLSFSSAKTNFNTERTHSDVFSSRILNNEKNAATRKELGDKTSVTIIDANRRTVSLTDKDAQDNKIPSSSQVPVLFHERSHSDSSNNSSTSQASTCQLAVDSIQEPAVERIRHVGRSVSDLKLDDHQTINNAGLFKSKSSEMCAEYKEHVGTWDASCKAAQLPQQHLLTSCKACIRNNQLSPTVALQCQHHGKHVYFRQPSMDSSTMFDEYFLGDSEVKTIDELEVRDRLAKADTTNHRTSIDSAYEEEHGKISLVEKDSKLEHTKGIQSRPNRPSKLVINKNNTAEADQGHERSRHDSFNSSSKMEFLRSDSFSAGSKSDGARRDSVSSKGSTPARCRSVTPTELGRRRHQSELSTASSLHDALEYFESLKELPLPSFTSCPQVIENKLYDSNFGHSLLGGYNDHYVSDFVLHGTSDTSFLKRLRKDLVMTEQYSILDEPVAEAVSIVADTSNWSVEIVSSRNKSEFGEVVNPAPLVCNMVESVQNLWRLRMAPEFCLMHMEDRLQEIYFKSGILAEYLQCEKIGSNKEICSLLGVDVSDLPLLMAVAGIHSPNQGLGLVS
ncbi:folliculin-interacting protein 1 isoform X2 [Lingula anatina]|uniref:Folliculin-interacting protein 1 isoform X2 n=1 Tax=Lingula anatina TaxID=7574 RepID=A0A1S3HKT3_LINAN|nr:folliculin-interacting protein 1 isoform X2 [Lingula anatina]|eukprot:XP_013386632.1 folliculin-interacting protein 1 isoform X2 [Lingula anatina]